MTETAPTAGYSAEDLAWFAKYYGGTEWMVHVVGPDEIHTRANPDLDEDDPINPPLIERTAHVLAKSINELHASIEARDPSPFNPSFHATVFHRGVPVVVPFGSDVLMAEPLERRDLNPIARVQDFLHVHVRVHGVSAPIAVIDESGEPGGHRWVLTAEDLGRALVPANRLRREELGLGPSRAADTDAEKAAAQRLAALEQRQERLWDIVLELRQKATARGLDPYKDPTAQALSAILTGDTGWRITYGTLIETRDDLDTAKARAVDLWERTKFEADEFETEWQPDVARGDGALALVGIEEDGTGFFTGVVISPLTADPQPAVQVPGQQEIPAEDEPADDAPTCRDCGTWPCSRHATDTDRAEYQRATGSDEAEAVAR